MSVPPPARSWTGAIPGPGRTLTLQMRRSPTMLTRPWVCVDGHRRRVRWGTVQVQVPADRPCLVEAYLPLVGRAYLSLLGGATGAGGGGFWLYPEHPPYLEYSAPYSVWFPGQLGPPGTTRHRGKGLTLGLLGAVSCLLLAMIGLGVLALAIQL